MSLIPGKTVSIEIVAPPSTPAGRKTLLRLCAKDPGVTRQKRQQSRKRPSWQTWRRGGRQWHHQMRSKTPVRLVAGNRYSVLATVDVIRDLDSVKRWVKVVTE